MSASAIRQRGTITQFLKGHFFEIMLEDHPEHKVFAHLSGKMRIEQITLTVGDEVSVELSPYDLTRGRIVWRHQPN